MEEFIPDPLGNVPATGQASGYSRPQDTIPLSSYVGRSHETGDLLALVSRPEIRLVTITGPGGAGKSRLARRVMAGIAPGVRTVFVPLASIRQPDHILHAIADALGMHDRATLEAVGSSLRATPTLLVLDNLEHLVGEAAKIVNGLLHSCPDVTVLGTSRARLALSSEHVYPLAGLNPEEARTLFLARAQATRHDFAATQADMSVIDTICQRVDRLPLGIELAAARTAVLSLPALQARLDRRLEVLTGGPRDAPERQRTMRDTVAWSYGLLDKREQQVYRRLGICIGGFTLEAVQAINGGDEAGLDEIAALIAASMVSPVASRAGEPRYAMLETVREFALEQLVDQGEQDATRAALLHHLIDLAERNWQAPTGREADRWQSRLVQDIANIRATLAWAVDHDANSAVRLASSLADLWNYHTGPAEGQRWLEHAMSHAVDLEPAIAARAAVALGTLAEAQGDLPRTEVEMMRALDLADLAGDERVRFIAAGILANVLRARGERVLSLACADMASHAAIKLGEPLAMAIATLNQGEAAMSDGDFPTAQALFEDAVAAHRQSGEGLGVAVARNFLGQAMAARGDLPGAAQQYSESLGGFATVSAWPQMASSLVRLAALGADRAPAPAVMLLAAAHSMLDGTGSSMLPHDRTTSAAVILRARQVLDEGPFAEAWASGQQLDPAGALLVVDSLVASLEQHDHRPSHGLSPRETQVLRLVAAGKSNRAIAVELSISERTVENHVFHILAKLDVDSRTTAATWAVRHNLA